MIGNLQRRIDRLAQRSERAVANVVTPVGLRPPRVATPALSVILIVGPVPA